jgi:membrane fusion protein (multidrug efflux system)
MRSNSIIKLKHVVWAGIGLVAATILGAVVHSGAKPTARAPGSLVVEVAPVEQKDVPIYGEWIGTLAGQVNADIKAQVSGYLLRRDYQEGSYVQKGQLLFEIDPRPFQAVLDQAKGQLAQAEAQLVQAEAQLATAQANQHKSELDVDKYTPLAKAEAVSQQDLDNAVQTNLANTAQVQAAKAAITAAKAQIQAGQAAVETASINLGFTRVASPINGIVGVAQAQVGDLVSASSGALTTVSTLDPIRDYFTVSEQTYLELHATAMSTMRRPATDFTVSAQEFLKLQKQLSSSDSRRWKLQLILADGSIYPYEGDFYFADRSVDQNTGSIQLAALFPNPGNVLRPGQYGKIRAAVSVRKGALLVPQPAVTELQGSYEVAVVGPDDRVAIRPVKVGERVGTMWVIEEGLKPSEQVVVEGQQMLRPGVTVQPKPFKNSDK